MLRVLILTLTFVVCADGSCFMGKTSYDEQSLERYCKLPGGGRLSIGDTKVTDTCYKCSCSKSGMQCCGIGIMAGVIVPPPGKKLVKDPPCAYHFEDVVLA